MRRLLLGGMVLASFSSSHAVVINEIRVDQLGNDTEEYFELAGSAGESLTGLTYIVIGDAGFSPTCGVIEAVVDLSGQSVRPDGFFVAAEDTLPFAPDLVINLNFENSDNVTHLLVQGFTGTDGQDLDTNDDGVLDVTPWAAVIDAVGLDEGTTPDCITEEYLYSPVRVGPDGTFVPGHVFRCGSGWLIGGFTFPTDDTPGVSNECDTMPPALTAAVAPDPLQVNVRFSEPVTRQTASVLGNYALAEADVPSRTLSIDSVSLSEDRTLVALKLGAALVNGTRYTVTVSNIADDAGNVIAANSTASFVFQGLSLTGPRFTFVPGLETYPIRFSVPSTIATAEVLLRIFDLQGRLRKTLVDSRRVGAAGLPGLELWDGRDDATELVPAGTYVVHLVVVDKKTGDRQSLQMPVVVATRLAR